MKTLYPLPALISLLEAKKDAKKAKIEKTMREFKQGKLKSSSGDTVTDPDQAIAIALSQARRMDENQNKPDIQAARTYLRKAIARHEKHIDGSEPTSEASQNKMMEEMKAALTALGSS